MRHAPFRWFPVLLLVLALAVPLLAACGSQTGTLEGQVLGMFNTTDQPKILKGATILIAGSRGDQPPVTTDASGKFKVTLPYDNYNVAASYAGLQTRQKSFQINSGKIESAGFVLVADGIQEPTSPPPPPANTDGYARGGTGIASDPWFWFWMFDRPYLYGYSRPAWVTYSPARPTVIVVDRRTDPAVAGNNNGYVRYSDPAHPVPGTKAAPVAKTVATGSKGITKPGSGAGAGSRAAPVAPPARPGSGTNHATGGSEPATRPVAPPSRPRSGGFSGGSKGRR